jgi:hypothetical protein
MAIKRKLTDQIARIASGLPNDDLVHIHVPPADVADDIIRGSEMFVNTVSKLVEERNDLRARNEELNRKCVFLSKTCVRLEAERDLCLRQTHEYVRANGEVGAIIGSMLALAERAGKANTRVQVISDTMPLVPTAPEPTAIYDQDGRPLDAPPAPTLEECESLSSVLARVD